MGKAIKRLNISIDAQVVAAFDINTIANSVYQHNFGLAPIAVNVEHLETAYFERLDCQLWMLSPPCQPFTRGGRMLDAEDTRSAGLLHMIGVLEAMQNPPKWIFLENVLNFERSQCRERLVRVLQKRGYGVEEYLVSPVDPVVGIPNDRLRYYLAATLGGSNDLFGHLIRSFGEVEPERPKVPCLRRIQEFLQVGIEDPNDYAVPLKYLTDYKNYRHDITWPTSQRSTTFTKAYGSKYIIGTGSFLQTLRLDEMVSQDGSTALYALNDPDVLVTLGLRFFTPREIARLHGFEDGEFSFPPNLPKIHQYRLLGNSLNVTVVGLVLQRLLSRGH